MIEILGKCWKLEKTYILLRMPRERINISKMIKSSKVIKKRNEIKTMNDPSKTETQKMSEYWGVGKTSCSLVLATRDR